MEISSFYCKLFVFVFCCYLSPPSFVITMSIHKTTGSQYFGIMPEKNAKVTHRTLPTPSSEGYKIVSELSYLYNHASNELYNAVKKFFGTGDKEDPQIHQSVYECEQGVCKMLALDDKQKFAFHENLKGKRPHPRNALTTKVKELDENKNKDQPLEPHSTRQIPSQSLTTEPHMGQE